MKGLTQAESMPVRRGMFIFLLMMVTVMFFGLIFSFLMACFWACIFAILFKGVFIWMAEKLNGKRSLAAFLTTLIILFSAVIPIGLVSIAVVNESKHLYESIEEGNIDPSAVLHRIEERIPGIEAMLTKVGVDREEVYAKANASISEGITLIGKRMWRYTQGAINFIIQFTLMLYLLFFLLRDGEKIIAAIRNALPMGNRIEDILFKRFGLVARATLKGTIIVATCQGLIGGTMFAILGIQGAVLWGVLMALLSLLPIGGSGIIWAPTAIIMFVQGHVTEGIIIVVVGFLGIGLIDNLLRPILVSNDTKIPDYVVLIATLGGLSWFGLSGFIIGPVIAALFMICWEITGELYGGKEG